MRERLRRSNGYYDCCESGARSPLQLKSSGQKSSRTRSASYREPNDGPTNPEAGDSRPLEPVLENQIFGAHDFRFRITTTWCSERIGVRRKRATSNLRRSGIREEGTTCRKFSPPERR